MDGDSSAHTKVTYPLIAGPVSGIEPVFNSGRLESLAADCLLRHAGRDACAVERAADELNGPGIDSKPFGYLAHAISVSRSRPMVG